MSYTPTTITLNWKPRFKSLCSICWVIVSKPTQDAARISSLSTAAMTHRCRGSWRQEDKRWSTTTDVVAKRSEQRREAGLNKIGFGFRDFGKRVLPFQAVVQTHNLQFIRWQMFSFFLWNLNVKTSVAVFLDGFEDYEVFEFSLRGLIVCISVIQDIQQSLETSLSFVHVCMCYRKYLIT